MKKSTKILIHTFIFMSLALPTLSFAADPVATGIVVTCPATGCGFNDLLALVNSIIKFILFDLALPVAAVMFAYAGFLLITAGGEAAHARTKAKNIFTHAVIGLVVAISCWIIVHTLLVIMGYTGASWIGL